MAVSKALNGKLVVLMGGSGFLGSQVAQALLKRGARLRIASRHPEKAFKLKPLANLGQIQVVRADATDKAAVQRVMTGADAAVNLVGAFSGNLRRLMGEAPGWMAEALASNGAAAFVHVSAIVPEQHDGNRYAEAKLLGEERVLAGFPAATIIRPSLLFGQGGGVTDLFAPLIARLPVMPVFAPQAQVAPTYVADVAEAAVRALEAPGTFGGNTYEVGGPEVMTMLELNRRIARAQHRDRSFFPVPDELGGLFAKLPGTPMNSDQWGLLKAGNVPASGKGGVKAFGIEPKPLGLFLDDWMTRYRKNGRFGERLSY
ncbi:complex I NDUFA9 subunit family protein [Qipengyuania sp.]|uniref:complex I NDUFA9 subunit family protein n=1 Tax=Qipengyuania sp. TaxID=2004515 RepID=UPI0035C80DEE